jgi:hypothetical protein
LTPWESILQRNIKTRGKVECISCNESDCWIVHEEKCNNILQYARKTGNKKYVSNFALHSASLDEPALQEIYHDQLSVNNVADINKWV